MHYLSELDKDQRRAVLHASQRGKQQHLPLVVNAGPGSGKTHLLACCAAHAIATGVDPSKILMLAFGRRAASELRGRLDALASHKISCKNVQCTTIHAFALSIVREFYANVGLPADFSVLSRDEADELLTLARQQLPPTGRKRLPPAADLRRLFSCKVNSQRNFTKAIDLYLPRFVASRKEIRTVLRLYSELKRDGNALDFDDLLVFCLRVLSDTAVIHEVRTRYSRLLVDEYQDTSTIQAQILRKLRPSGKGVTLVGDPRQAIMSFRGANSKIMSKAVDLFSRKARTVTLRINYRSCRRIVTACNALMESYRTPMLANESKGKWPAIHVVPDGLYQARTVAAGIAQSRRDGTPLREQAVLVRTMDEAKLLEEELVLRNIPVIKYGGRRKPDPEAVCSFIRLVRWLVSPVGDDSGVRLASLAKETNSFKGRANGASAKVASPRRLPETVGLLARNRPVWKRLKTLRSAIKQGIRPTRHHVSDIIRLLVDAKLCSFSEKERTSLTNVIANETTWQSFMDNLAIGSEDDEGHSADAVTISTIHASKGKQWRIVRILNVVSGMMPRRPTTKASVEEERRLLFVAMSRPRIQLDIYAPRHVSVTGCYNSNASLSPLVGQQVVECCRTTQRSR